LKPLLALSLLLFCSFAVAQQVERCEFVCAPCPAMVCPEFPTCEELESRILAAIVEANSSPEIFEEKSSSALPDTAAPVKEEGWRGLELEPVSSLNDRRSSLSGDRLLARRPWSTKRKVWTVVGSVLGGVVLGIVIENQGGDDVHQHRTKRVTVNECRGRCD